MYHKRQACINCRLVECYRDKKSNGINVYKGIIPECQFSCRYMSLHCVHIRSTSQRPLPEQAILNQNVYKPELKLKLYILTFSEKNPLINEKLGAKVVQTNYLVCDK